MQEAGKSWWSFEVFTKYPVQIISNSLANLRFKLDYYLCFLKFSLCSRTIYLISLFIYLQYLRIWIYMQHFIPTVKNFGGVGLLDLKSWNSYFVFKSIYMINFGFEIYFCQGFWILDLKSFVSKFNIFKSKIFEMEECNVIQLYLHHCLVSFSQ